METPNPDFHREDPTEDERELLTILAEEACEIGHAATSVLRHGWNTHNPDVPEEKRITNREHLAREIRDLDTIRFMLFILGCWRNGEIDLNTHRCPGDIERKLRYTRHQNLGLFEEQIRVDNTRSEDQQQ